MIKYALIICSAIAILCALAGCGRVIVQEGAAPLSISPSAGEVDGVFEELTLYFRYMDEMRLSAETRAVKVNLDERIERRAIEELAKGPSANHPDLLSILPTGTGVLSLNDADGILFIALSREFLAVNPSAPADWEADEGWRAQILSERQLVLAAIVNTAIDNSPLKQVQILLQTADGQSYARVNRSLFFANAGDATLGPMDRNGEYVLTPANVVRAALSALQRKDWQELYKYIALRDLSGVSRLARDAFISAMAERYMTVISYEVGDALVSLDGSRAQVDVKLRMALSGGRAVDRPVYPVQLMREAEAWKISYSALWRMIQ